jgi:hypothetical protein
MINVTVPPPEDTAQPISDRPGSRTANMRPLPPADSTRWRGATRASPTDIVVASCIAVHLVAAALTYRDLARDLYALFDATPRLLVLETGLTRLTAASVFLPGVIPTTLLVIVAFWLGGWRRVPDVARWLAIAAVPLALDTVMRAIGVLIAPAPSNIGDLLDLPARFSPGPRMLLDLVGAHPGPSVSYWAVICTVAAAISGWCVVRALLAGEDAERAATVRRHRRGGQGMERLQVTVAVIGTWIALGFAGQVVLPFATQLFLKLFG